MLKQQLQFKLSQKLSPQQIQLIIKDIIFILKVN